LVFSAFQNSISNQFETFEALHSGFISVVVSALRVGYNSVSNFGKNWTPEVDYYKWRRLKTVKVISLGPRTNRNFSTPGSVAHTQNYWRSATDVAWFTFVTDDGTVSAS